MLSMKHTLLKQVAVVAALLLLVTAVACSDDTVSATPFEGSLTASPTAGGAVSDLPEALAISVSDGSFDEAEINLTAGSPTQMMVTNEDDQDYYLRVDSLITDTLLPANQTVEIGFTTPSSDVYEAELLDGPDGEQVATTVMIVREPGGGTP